MAEAFLKNMFAPSKGLSDSDSWLQLLPKKLHSEVKLGRGTLQRAWGVHITDGVNTFGAVLVALFIMIVSCIVGIAYAVAAKNVSTACAIAALIAAFAALLLGLLQLRRRH